MKTYICEDGCYLDIDERDFYHIAWYIPEDGDFGGYVGEIATQPKEAPKVKETWEMWVAHKAIEPLADCRRDMYGFYFESLKDAKVALLAANTALQNEKGLPWPEWAVRAKDAGWTPPKGWKP